MASTSSHFGPGVVLLLHLDSAASLGGWGGIRGQWQWPRRAEHPGARETKSGLTREKGCLQGGPNGLPISDIICCDGHAVGTIQLAFAGTNRKANVTSDQIIVSELALLELCQPCSTLRGEGPPPSTRWAFEPCRAEDWCGCLTFASRRVSNFSGFTSAEDSSCWQSSNRLRQVQEESFSPFHPAA